MKLKGHKNLKTDGAMIAFRWQSSAMMCFGLSPFISATTIMPLGRYQFVVEQRSSGGDNPGRHK